MDWADPFIRLFDYDSWSSLKVFAILQDHPQFDTRGEAVQMFAHIIASQQVWCRRINGESYSDLKLWPDYELRKSKALLNEMHTHWTELISERVEDPDQLISYQNSKGAPFETRLSDILQHLIIHGQHHRAQIAVLIRKAGITPPSTDFIFYTRNQQK